MLPVVIILNMMKKLIGKIACFIGIHRYKCMIQDCIEEFGYIPNDGRMPKNSKCERCDVSYGK
jgi:hypothetical protein